MSQQVNLPIENAEEHKMSLSGDSEELQNCLATSSLVASEIREWNMAIELAGHLVTINSYTSPM